MKILKLLVNTGQLMFSGEIDYYWPLNSVEKSLENIVFLCIIYCVTNTVAVMYSRSIPMAKSEISVFKAKKWKYVGFFLFLTTIIYIFEEIFWKKCK